MDRRSFLKTSALAGAGLLTLPLFSRGAHAAGSNVLRMGYAEEVLTLDPKYSEAYLYLGIIHRVRNEHDAAKRNFEKVRQLDPRGKVGAEAEKNLRKMGL